MEQINARGILVGHIELDTLSLLGIPAKTQPEFTYEDTSE
jgi:hypothetical protein